MQGKKYSSVQVPVAKLQVGQINRAKVVVINKISMDRFFSFIVGHIVH